MQYWLHGVFVGPLWVSGRLHPGGVGVTRGWREQLESDVAPLLEDATPVWVCADNAYYQGDFVRFCAERGWDYSVSVTHAAYRRPILEGWRVWTSPPGKTSEWASRRRGCGTDPQAGRRRTTSSCGVCTTVRNFG